jgi:hypothetical protein
VKGESRFAHRLRWLPDLNWQPPPPDQAHMELVRRYLATYGPATIDDIAHWLGGRLGDARRWVDALRDDIMEIDVDDTMMLLRVADLDDLHSRRRPGAAGVHLLGKYDPLLLAHKEKTWLVDPDDQGRVWRSGGRVEAVVLFDHEIVGTWRYRRGRRDVDLAISLFLDRTADTSAIEDEARGVAGHFGVDLGDITITREES